MKQDKGFIQKCNGIASEMRLLLNLRCDNRYVNENLLAKTSFVYNE